MDSPHILGLLGGLGALGLGYVISRISVWSSSETERLKQRPMYCDFTRLGQDISSSSDGALNNVFIEGYAVKDHLHGGGGLFVDSCPTVDGPAKLVQTTRYVKVYNSEHQKWEEHSDTITNQCISIPFRFKDRYGKFVTMENIHNASNLKSILNLVNQSRISPEQRTVGDVATNMVTQEIPNGSLTKEYLLQYGTKFAGLGDAVKIGGTSTHSDDTSIVFIPHEVGSSISALIYHHELIVKIEQIVSTVLMVSGGLVTAVELYIILKKTQSRNI